ncbi:MAG TPA: hypothetical protein VKV15_05510 [Bryobacteraceae bacterium]|nr:hypothetical protein [Bryobacteraceae bacterium]
MEVLETIREMPLLANVPVAILTSSESPGDLHRTMLVGATRYIRKSCMPEDFLQEVGEGVRELLLLAKEWKVAKMRRESATGWK